MVIDARYKSVFIMPAVLVLSALLLLSLIQALITDHERIAWLGAAISAIPLPALLAWLMLGSPERTSENLPFLLAIAAVGVVIAMWQQFIEGATGWAPTIVALTSAVLFAVYVFWYSNFGRIASGELSVGASLPDFELTDSAGKLFSLEKLAGAPAVLMFYRGNWCPLCMAQVRELAGRYQDLDAMGINVVLISPQPEEESRKLAEVHGVPFRYLVDQDNRVAQSLGIAVKNGVPVGIGGYPADTVMPTLIVTNANGTIIFSDQADNYRVRPEPDVFLAILRRTGAMPQ